MTAIIGYNGISADRLRSIVERYERLDEEIKGLRADQKDLMQEAKSAGFDPKALRTLIAERRKDADELAEHQAMVDLYREALGDFAGTPLARAMEPV